MDNPLGCFRNRDRAQGLHVLLVESDSLELKTTGTRLLLEGCGVSTCQTANNLYDVIESLQPDLVLLDPLMPGMNQMVLLARCGSGALPPVALHTKVFNWLLRDMLDLHDFVGVIRKTDDDQAFREAFQAIADRVVAGTASASLPCPSPPAASGTHRIADSRLPPLTVPRVGRSA